MKGNRVTNIYYLKLLLIHIGIAFAVYLFRPIAPLIAIFVIFYFIFLIIRKDNKNNEALMAAAYISGAEVFFRSTDALVFYETGKYMVIIFLVIGMLYKGSSSKAYPFYLYLLLLIPGILIASYTLSYDENFRKLIAFNLSGPVSAGVAAIYCCYKKIKREDFQKILIMLLMPIISHMIYLFLYTPSLREGIINLAGNYSATGGYGPNQISLIFGFGAFILATRIFTIKNMIINIIDLVLLAMMGYRAVISFSRGGVFTGIICIIAFLALYYFRQNTRGKIRFNFKFVLLIISVVMAWTFSSIQTFGLIGNRYSNENKIGQTKGDITTGRVELFATEMHAFIHHPVLGIGVGKGKEYREENLGISIASHNEISRMLSEHGLLGLASLLILIFVPIIFWTKFKNNYYFLALMVFWFLTINYTAMRVALPGFVYGLTLLYIVDEKKNPVHRKRLNPQ